jgi:NTE family protein
MNTSPESRTDTHDRALVLAGAGAAGNAWQLGLIAGLAESGVDFTAADLIVGTSAGSTVAAQITSGTRPADLYAAILGEPPQPPRPGSPTRPSTPPARTTWTGPTRSSPPPTAPPTCAANSGPPPSRRTPPTVRPHPAGTTSSRRGCPVRAVDAHSGEPVVFDRDSGVDLVDAVAASTSSTTPYRIGERRYLNGGYRRSSNADLASGYRRVVILDPFGGRSRHPLEWGMDLATHVAELRATGSTVETVFPDEGSGDVFNSNALDPATRLPAARGGYEQARTLAVQLAELWR